MLHAMLTRDLKKWQLYEFTKNATFELRYKIIFKLKIMVFEFDMWYVVSYAAISGHILLNISLTIFMSSLLVHIFLCPLFSWK